MNIAIGSTYKDKITGFTGLATGHCTYISGCNQTLLQPRVDDKGEFRDGKWLDDQRLELVAAESVTLNNGSTPGCDTPAPVR